MRLREGNSFDYGVEMNLEAVFLEDGGDGIGSLSSWPGVARHFVER